MQLTVLGACGSFPGPDGACAGYLVEAADQVLLLDCGSGVLSRLQRYYAVEDLDGIIVSHLHFDHAADLLVLQYGLGSLKLLRGGLPQLPLHLPRTPERVIDLLDHEDVYARRYIEDGAMVQLGAVSLSFARMEHSLESYAITVQAEDRTLVYSGDTVANPRLVDVAQGADLFLCESTGLQSAAGAGEVFVHMTAQQAAETAQRAGVRRLLLTHRWYEYPPEEYVAEARAVFDHSELAEEFVTYQV